MTCANNCKGVNPNAVIIGGTAVLAASTVTLQQVLAFGVGVAAAAGGGAAVVNQMMNQGCPATNPCQASAWFDLPPHCLIILILRDRTKGIRVRSGAAAPSGRPAGGQGVRGDVERK